jgi:hypothetical protein
VEKTEEKEVTDEDDEMKDEEKKDEEKKEEEGKIEEEGEEKKKEKKEESQRSAPRVRESQPEQTDLATQTSRHHQGRVSQLLEVTDQRLGGPPRSQTLQRRGATRVQGHAVHTQTRAVRPVRGQEEEKQHQVVSQARLHHGRLRGTHP